MEAGLLTPQSSQLGGLVRYVGAITASTLVIGLAIGFALPAGADALGERSATRAPVRINYADTPPVLAAAQLDIARMTPVRVQVHTPDTSVVSLAATGATDVPSPAAASRTVHRITANGLNIRTRPSSSSPVAGALRRGDEVTVLETRGSWQRLQYRGRPIGWAFARYISEEKPTEDRIAAVQ
jgi:hypothetical protein